MATANPTTISTPTSPAYDRIGRYLTAGVRFNFQRTQVARYLPTGSHMAGARWSGRPAASRTMVTP